MTKMICKRTVAFLLACLMMCTLVACTTTLKGTYTSKEGLIEQSFTFKEDNKVEVSAFGIDVEGEYLNEDGEITITYSLLGLSYEALRRTEALSLLTAQNL